MAARSRRRAVTVSGSWSCRHRESETFAAEFGGRVSPPCAPDGSTSRVSPFAPPAGGRPPFGIRPFRYTPPSRSEPFCPRSGPFPLGSALCARHPRSPARLEGAILLTWEFDRRCVARGALVDRASLKMSLGWIVILVGSGALVGGVARWFRAQRTMGPADRRDRRRGARYSAARKPATVLPDGKRCAEIAGGPLDLMADYDVSHPYWHIAVEDD